MKEKTKAVFGIGPFIDFPRISGTSFTLNASLIVAFSDYFPGPNSKESEGTNILLATGASYITSMRRPEVVKHLERPPVRIRLVDFPLAAGGTVYLDPSDVHRVATSEYREAGDGGYEGPLTLIAFGPSNIGIIYRVKGTPEDVYAKLHSA